MRIGYLHTGLSEDIPQALASAKQAGADGVEVSYATPEEVRALRDDKCATELAKLASAHDIEVSSLCLGFICRGPSLIDSPKETQEASDLIVRAIELASEVGAGVVLLPFFGNSAIELESEFDQAIHVLEGLLEQAEKNKVVLGVESTLNFNQHKFLLDYFAHTDCVRAYYDTGNALARKLDLPTGIRELGKTAIGGIHFKDVRITTGSPPEYDLPLGGGSVNFRAVVQALKAVGYDGWIILETTPGDDALARAKANIAFTRALIGTAG